MEKKISGKGKADPFLPLHWGPRGGWIEAVVGSMFSGKTQELIRRLRLATIARQKVQVFNSALDVRYAKNHIVSHDLSRIASQSANKSKDVIRLVQADTQVVGIDEVQFFDDGIVDVCERLANDGRRVIVAGLDQDYRGVPFPVTAQIMGVSEFVTKNLAICAVCGALANRSQRLSVSRKIIEVGSADKYEARCRQCFTTV
ncbi:MAG: thymidine kinase [Elusimicrobiota bacterium]